MPCKITVIQKPTYTHFIVEGENTVENTLHYIEEIYHESTVNNYSCILIEEHLEGKRLGTMEVFDLVSRTSQKLFGFFKAIAYVNINSNNQSIEFIENVAVNRALPLHAFKTVEEAEKWLQT